MAENIYLDLAVTVACERYNLDELEWTLFTFTDGSKAITIGLENINTGAKVRASFPRIDIRFEEMKRWSDDKKMVFVKNLIADGHELPEELAESFHDVMQRVEFPNTVSEEDTVLVEEETEQEFNAKVGIKKPKKFKRKEVTA